MKTRFAPSPTGYLHLGNVRTALFSVLLAKAQNGAFLLRIEDTDQARSTAEFADHLQTDLRWLGLEWQEGPYYQSQRHNIYNDYYQHLEKSGLVYPCFCSDTQLAIARKVQLASGQPPRYSGTCQKLTAEEIAEKIAQGLKPVLRFRVPENQLIEFNDFVRGPQQFRSQDIGDFIIRRADGTAPFFFCNAVDDATMGVTHVLRGEDHLTNTPRQLLILQALKLPLPHYGHLAMIVGPDGSPLSKRHGSRSLKELREAGYLPSAVVNYLARLGHYYANNDFMDLTKLAQGFTVTSIGKAPAHFDPAQLLYWQKQAVMHLTPEEAWQWFDHEIQTLVPAAAQARFIQAVQPNALFPSNAIHWAKVFFTDSLEYTPEVAPVLKEAGKAFFQTVLTLMPQYGTDFKALSQALQQQGIKGKALFHPLRAALTGQTDGPEMAHIFELLGVERIKQRLQQAANLHEQ